MKNITNNIRGLALDIITNAGAGHSGIVLSGAPIIGSLFQNAILFDPAKPNFVDRDRFVLSAGHASALLYSVLHAYGYDISINDLKQFRTGNSKVSGHPELNPLLGIEMTTGPLGQGLASGVGMAIAETMLAAKFNKPDLKIVDHYTYVFAGDGCVMEGVANEATSLAGTLKLSKLIVLYDCNKATLDASTSVSFDENVAKRYEAQGWNVISVDGEKEAEIASAISKCKSSQKPSLIICNTQIGYGSSLAGNCKCHGKVFSKDEVLEIKKNLKVKTKEFELENDAKILMKKVVAKNQKIILEKQKLIELYSKKYPRDYAAYVTHFTDFYTANLKLKDFEVEAKNEATRVTAHDILNRLSDKIPNLVVGSADLSSSTLCKIDSSDDYSAKNRLGKNIKFGVREHAMGAICNGIALHGGLYVACSTFLSFADYLKPSIRLAALMNLPVLYIFTHDSIAVGADGATHQPVEQIATLRAIPNLSVVRPAGANECEAGFAMHFSNLMPTAMILTRQPVVSVGDFVSATKGGYIADGEDKAKKLDAILIASGSEVGLCIEAKKILSKSMNVRVVSIPCYELFDVQTPAYKSLVLPDSCRKRVGVEMSAAAQIWKYVGLDGAAVSVDEFGFSAKPDVVMKNFGFTPEHIANICKKLK